MLILRRYLLKKMENGSTRTNIRLGYPKEKTNLQRMSNSIEKYRYMCKEKILEKKKRKSIMIITFKQASSHSIGRKEKK